MSVANKDEAFKCLSIAKRHLGKGDGERARHFGEKAKTLFPCPEVDTFLRSLQSSGASTTRSESKPSTKQAPADSAGASTSSAPRNGNAATPAQREMLARIRGCKGDYYRVLGVERSADDDEIKKAYRKLALKLHPDKCQAQGAEEAFKEVSKAFTCLADPQKRAYYDRTGHEDSSAAAAAQRQQGGTGNGMHFQGDVSPEDLFNMMFGGGMGGFGMGPMHFGGVRGHPQFRQRRNHQQQQQGEQPQQQDARQRFGGLLNILGPVLLLLLALFSNSPTPPAALHFSRSYPMQMFTEWNSVPYYVKDRGGFVKEYPSHSIKRQKFEHMIEQEWKSEVQQSCNFERMKERELHRRTRSRNRSAPLPHVPKPSCDKLRDFHSGIRADSRSRESLADSDRVIHDEF